MPEINPLTNNQIFLKKIAENTGSDYDIGDVSEINPITIDQILLKEIAANTAGQSGDITELEGKVADNTSAIEAIVNEYGAKNLLPLNLDTIKGLNSVGTWSGNIYTINGGTITVNTNENGSVTSIVANGGPFTSLVSFYLTGGSPVFESNKYILNGITGGSSTTYCLTYLTPDWNWGTLNDGEKLLNIDVSLVRIDIQAGATLNSVTFKPMIRDARITDPTYVPYAMTNRELTERFKVLTIPISSVAIAANGINLLHNNPCPTGYIPISAMFDRGAISNDSVLLSVYLDSGTDVRVIMYNCSSSSIELNGSVKVLCIKA